MTFENWSAFGLSSAVIAATYFIASVTIIIHILLTKASEKTALAWVVLVIAAPILGAFIYLFFGINRINVRARKLRRKEIDPLVLTPSYETTIQEDLTFEFTAVKYLHEGKLSFNSTIEALVDGDNAYPQMLAAINAAEKEISLASYIFNHDAAGKLFVKALKEAKDRGVNVRVIVDDVGLKYSFPSIKSVLRKAGINTVSFLPTAGRYLQFINLRNHRKVLICDGKIVFTGGMNISEGNLCKSGVKRPVHDIHFKLEGKVVEQYSRVFEQDWGISTGELIQLLPYEGNMTGKKDFIFANVIPDGPDEYFKMYENAVLIAIATAKKSIKIMTPYFLPNDEILAALRTACYRGVNIELIVPKRNNIRFFDWAMQPILSLVTKYGVQVYKSVNDFDHSKLLIADNYLTVIGSGNWDERSFRLNFEINTEIVSENFAYLMTSYFNQRKNGAVYVSGADIDNLPLHYRLRNAAAMLFKAYL